MTSTYIYFEPIEWTQQIRDYPSINVRGRYLRVNCRVAASCHVLIDGKIDLRDFTSIQIGILEGTPEKGEMPEGPKNRKTLGVLHYIRDQNYPHGWFYLENSEWFTAVWDQVREGGYSDCRICVGAGPVEGSGAEDWIWNSDSRLYIDSVDIQFDRKTNRPASLASSGRLPTVPRGMNAQTVALWVCGLLASAIIGGVVGAHFDAPYKTDVAFLGIIAGPLVFTCARFWMTSGKLKS